MDDQLRAAALEYHRQPCAGKISVTPTQELVNQHDLALAYSPGVAAACDAIVADPREAQTLTSRANLVAVITVRMAPRFLVWATSGRLPANR
jgi:malate dehydrogenase (oxaloacetate-decarboxylating)(NADP+)